jgi:hypothetical protein
MTVSSTHVSYSSYESISYRKVAKSQNETNSFQQTLAETSNKKDESSKSEKVDLFDFEYFNSLSDDEKSAHLKLIGEESGFEKSIAFGMAASFGDIDMQKAVFETTSTMSKSEILTFSFDMSMGASRYLSGMELKASYSVNVENGYINYGLDDVNTSEYFKNMTATEFDFFFSTMSNSHIALSGVVGKEQAMPYANAYKNILTSYKNSLEDSSIIDEKYSMGLQRYNSFKAGDDFWFENSAFSKDADLKHEFVKFLSNLDVDEYMKLSANLWSSFGSGLMEDENGNIVPGNHEKNPKKEFSTLANIKNYFKGEIDDLEEGARKFGGDASEMISFLNRVLNFFNNYQENENKDDEKNNNINSKKNEKEDIEKLRAMVEDIFSLMKTGFTVSELESLQELLRKLKEEIKDGNYNEDQIEKLLSKIEKEVAIMEKRVNGQAIVKSEEGNLKQNDTKTEENPTQEFLERIDTALTKLKTLEKGLIAREDAATKSEVLAMIKEFSNT